MPRPTIIRQLCPVCRMTLVEIAYREGADNFPAPCYECDNSIAVKKEPSGNLVAVGPRNPNFIDSKIKICPICSQNPLRVWRAPNNAIAKVHGAYRVSSRTFRCDKCGKNLDLT